MSDDSPGVDRNRRRLLTLLALCPLAPACEFADVIATGSGARSAAFSVADPGFEALAEVGGMACAKVDIVDVLLLRASETEVFAYERFCPHQGLDMGPCDRNPVSATFDMTQGHLRCRWHGSTFALDGAYVSGPASRDLQAFDVQFDAAAGRGAVFLPGASMSGPPPGVTKAASPGDDACGGDA